MRLDPLKINLLLLWVASYTLEVTTSYVIHPSGGQGRQNLNSNGQSETTTTTPKGSSPPLFQCLQVTTKIDPSTRGKNDDKKTVHTSKLDYKSALSELFQNWKKEPTSSKSSKKQNSLAILFISPEWAPYLQNIAKDAQERYVGSDSKLITIVGGGIIGGGKEVQDSPSMSFFGGILPKGSNVDVFHGSDGEDEKDSHIMSNLNKFSFSSEDSTNDNCDNIPCPSHLIFADPFCSKFHNIDFGDGIVAGGISIGDRNQPSIAIGKKVLPTGSFAGVSFHGNVGLQVVVSHGCRPVGPTYRVTSVKGAAVHKLNGESAFERLQDTIRMACKKDQDLFNSLGVLCGVHHNVHQDDDDDETQGLDNNGDDVEDVSDKFPEDFILREVNGFRPRSGSILVCGQPQIQKGDYIRFHVRSSETALQDWESVLKRVRTERMFLGNNQVGSPLGAIQISCMGRGTGLFDEERNVDLNHVQQLLDHNQGDDNNDRIPPIAGMFANAEIGPVRLRMGTPSGLPNQMKEKQRTYLHGYSTVVAMICDYSKMEDPNSIEMMMPELSCLGNSTFDSSAWE